MIISVKPVFRPRSDSLHVCFRCALRLTEPHLRIYGTPDAGGKPLEIRIHPKCIPQHRIDTEPKIVAALERLREKFATNGDSHGS